MILIPFVLVVLLLNVPGCAACMLLTMSFPMILQSNKESESVLESGSDPTGGSGSKSVEIRC